MRFVNTLGKRSKNSLRRWLAVPVIAVMASTVQAGWMNFQNETSTRLIAPEMACSGGTNNGLPCTNSGQCGGGVCDSLGANDTQEKDFAWGDLDNDGDTDIVLVRKEKFTTTGRRVNVLYMHEGMEEGHAINDVFVNRTDELIPEFNTPTNDRDVAVFDVDNDGWLDIVTATTRSDGLPKTISHPRVYMNQGTVAGVFQGFVYEEPRIPQLRTVAGLAVAPRFCSIAHGDVTGDGFEDLYFGDYDAGSFDGAEPSNWDLNDRLLINQGNGFFVDETATRTDPQVVLSAFGAAAVIIDMNNDGIKDIVRDTALNPPQHVSIAYNDPANVGIFTSINRQVVFNEAPYHIWVGDLNHDVLPDIIVSDDNQDHYWTATGVGADNKTIFTRRPLTGSQSSAFGGNNIIVDLDHDGWNDAIVASVDVDDPSGSCTRQSFAFRNHGNLPIPTLATQDGDVPWIPPGVHDFAVFDMNGDDWNDIMVGGCSVTQIWMNTGIRVNFEYPNGVPELLTPSASTQVLVDFEIDATQAAAPVPGSFKQHVSINYGGFVESDLTAVGGGRYAINLPGVPCATTVNYYVSFLSSNGTLYVDPPGAPGSTHAAIAAIDTTIVLDEHFELANPNWTIENIALTGGAWVRVNPEGSTTGGQQAQPFDDFGGGTDVVCYITQQYAGGNASGSDVDGGPTILTSPVINLDGADALVSYARWHFTTGGTPDALVTQVSNDGTNWVNVSSTLGTGSAWQLHQFRVGQFVTPTATVRVRFSVADQPADSTVTESGIDNFKVTQIECLDDVAPLVQHGVAGQSFAASAFGGYIDPRRESTNGVDFNAGISQLTIRFNEPVTAPGGGPLTADNFTLTETGAATPPSITSLQISDPQTVRLTLSRLLTIREWLTVAASVEDSSGNAIVNAGNQGPGVNEGDRVDVGFLPGDVDQSSIVNPLDLLRFKQYVNGVQLPTRGTVVDYIDTNRSGGVNPLDLLSFKQLINGVSPPATQSWSGKTMLHPRP